jgi:hypothetical protein
VNALMDLKVPLNAGNFLPRRGRIRFSVRTKLVGRSVTRSVGLSVCRSVSQSVSQIGNYLQTLTIVLCSKKSVTFPKLDLFPFSGDSLGRGGGTC